MSSHARRRRAAVVGVHPRQYFFPCRHDNCVARQQLYWQHMYIYAKFDILNKEGFPDFAKRAKSSKVLQIGGNLLPYSSKIKM